MKREFLVLLGVGCTVVTFAASAPAGAASTEPKLSTASESIPLIDANQCWQSCMACQKPCDDKPAGSARDNCKEGARRTRRAAVHRLVESRRTTSHAPAECERPDEEPSSPSCHRSCSWKRAARDGVRTRAFNVVVGGEEGPLRDQVHGRQGGSAHRCRLREFSRRESMRRGKVRSRPQPRLLDQE